MAESHNRAAPAAEMLVGVSAVIIGLAALGVSLYEARLMRAEQRAAVLPIIELGSSYNRLSELDDQLHFAIQVENVGTGPAIIRDVRIQLDGKPAKNWGDIVQRLDWPEGAFDGYVQSQINGRTLPSERRVDAFSVRGDAASYLFQETGRFRIAVCYCSVFEECWRVELGEQRRKQSIGHCSSDGDSFVQ